jgi:hypothetical protein
MMLKILLTLGLLMFIAGVFGSSVWTWIGLAAIAGIWFSPIFKREKQNTQFEIPTNDFLSLMFGAASEVIVQPIILSDGTHFKNIREACQVAQQIKESNPQQYGAIYGAIVEVLQLMLGKEQAELTAKNIIDTPISKEDPELIERQREALRSARKQQDSDVHG